VECKEDTDWVKACRDLVEESVKKRGGGLKHGRNIVGDDMRKLKFRREDTLVWRE